MGSTFKLFDAHIKEYDFDIESITPTHLENSMSELRQADEILSGLYFGLTGQENMETLVKCINFRYILVESFKKHWKGISTMADVEMLRSLWALSRTIGSAS